MCGCGGREHWDVYVRGCMMCGCGGREHWDVHVRGCLPAPAI